ncbi:FecR family protein [Niabella ginsengisoli]|uniref:FecR protein domain-containing protein n=1 Tax=Niabella ginsengisoli TaxID=522298 RepID=A0ABS9SMQ2_9BACT|nr:hypothetical protein [Niabella ginsengisoli]MCH5599647.1 hypothetical protein [Niabella ginsengisoli]
MDKQVTIVMIQRFFNNECSEDEAKLVASYLKENNDVLKAYLPDETLQQAEITNELSDVKKNELLQNVTRNIDVQRRKVYFKRAGLAAAILLGVFFAGKFALGDFNSDNKIFAVSQSSRPIKRFENKTGRSHLVRLPDGSKVSLMSGAAIEFSKEFNEDRNIILTGKAFLKSPMTRSILLR